MKIPRYLMVHKLTFAPVIGEGADGPILGDLVTVRAYIEDGTEQAFTSPDGHVETATGQVVVDPGLAPAPGSQVERSDGGTATVVKVRHLDHPRAPSHTVIHIR